MDQQTLQLLITAVTAVVAALGGAGVTGYINHKNTLKQLEASKAQADQQWKETRAIERERWTRDKKTEAYSRFLRLASPLVVSNLLEESASDLELRDFDMDVALSDVMVFGSEQVVKDAVTYRNAFSEINSALTKLQREVGDHFKEQLRQGRKFELSDVTQTALDKAGPYIAAKKPGLVKSFGELVHLMKEDSGIVENGTKPWTLS